MNVCPKCGYGSEAPGPCPNCDSQNMMTVSYTEKSLTYAELISRQRETINIQGEVIAKQNETIQQQSKLIEEIYDRLDSAKRTLTQADVPELTLDGKRSLALNERIEILAQAVREVIKDWHDNEYGFMAQDTKQKVTSSVRSYITQAIQRLSGL